MSMGRAYSSGMRSRGTRAQRKILLLVVDGASEDDYFEKIAKDNRDIRVRIKESKVAGLDTMLRKCERCMIEHKVSIKGGDRVAIITDVDEHGGQELQDLDEECTRNGIELHISNPSFEVWLLMHYRDLTRHYEQCELESAIGDELGRPYVKSYGIDITGKGVEAACERAERILQCKETRIIDCLNADPGTTLHFLIRSIFVQKPDV